MTFYERLRKLFGWRGGRDAKVISLYLTIGGVDKDRALTIADTLWENTKEVTDHGYLPEKIDKVIYDLGEQIETAQAEGYDGLAMFVCSSPPLRETFKLRFAFEDQLEISNEPQTWQLAYYEEEYEQALVLSLGVMLEVAEIHMGDTIARHPVSPSHGRTQEQEASALLHRMLRDSPQAHLILLGPPDRRVAFENILDSALRDRIIGVHDEALVADEPAFLRTIHRIQQAYERRSEAEGIQILLETRKQKEDSTAIELGKVIDSINQGTIQKLYLLQNFSCQGWLCDACDRLGQLPSPPVCTACGATVSPVELMHHLIRQARGCGAEIETVLESDALAHLGGVAAEIQLQKETPM